MLETQLATSQFKMRCSPQDRTMIEELARRLERSQSDTVRLLVRSAYAVLMDQEIKEPNPNHQEQAAAV